MTPDAWRGRRVLLTGHTGFKGAWLALWLRSLGAHVAGYSLAPPTQPSLYAEARVGEGLEAGATADIRDLGTLQSFTRAFDPEVVFHLAAQSLVRRSYVDPRETWSTNVEGTACLLEAARACPALRAVVVVTSDKCYRNDGAARPFREDDALGGSDPYSASKAAAEIVSSGYRASFFDGDGRPALATARAGNVIGGGDWAQDRLVTDAVKAFAAGAPLRLRHPQSTRPWQHVLDALHGYLILAEALLAGDGRCAGGWNFGPAPEDERPVSWLAARLAARWGEGAGWRPDQGPHPAEAATLRLDSSRARRDLGWRPKLQLEAAVDWTVDWYRGHLGTSGSAHALCTGQIERFQALAS
ncbi:MAG: CDP-glucose 4,6-dehydratase [Betaproteobacteria bacterium]